MVPKIKGPSQTEHTYFKTFLAELNIIMLESTNATAGVCAVGATTGTCAKGFSTTTVL
jgi:hypothetical protein